MKCTATVIMARCSGSKESFGMRMEKTRSGWLCDWAFPMRETAAQKEGFDRVTVSGEIFLADEYPGCPYCGVGGFVQCGACGRLSCYSSERTSIVCPHCGHVMESISFEGNFDSIKGDSI